MTSRDDWGSILKRSRRDRIYYLYLPCWWPYDAAQKVLNALEDLFALPKNDRPRCMLLTGESNMGKSRILKELELAHPSFREAESGTLQRPVLMIDVPTPATPERILEELLAKAGIPLASQSINQLSCYFERRMPRLGIQVVLFDEGQRAGQCTRICRGHVLETFKWVSTVLKRPVVVAGIPELAAYFDLDSQLKRRFDRMELPCWRPNDPNTKRFIKSVLDNMPLREGYDPRIYQDEGMIDALVSYGLGVTGGILAALQDTAKHVLRDGREFLRFEDAGQTTQLSD